MRKHPEEEKGVNTPGVCAPGARVQACPLFIFCCLQLRYVAFSRRYLLFSLAIIPLSVFFIRTRVRTRGAYSRQDSGFRVFVLENVFRISCHKGLRSAKAAAETEPQLARTSQG